MDLGKILGYRRENGRIGIRNHVVILSVDDISNAACEAVANNIAGVIALPHSYGRLQFGEDLKLFFRTIIGMGASPNVAAAIVIGIEPEWTNKIVEEIAAKTGKPVSGFSIERSGDLKIIEEASKQAAKYVKWASELRREEIDFKEVWVSVKCGESDTTSGLASNPTVGYVIDVLDEAGGTCSFGETTEITGAEEICAKRAATSKVRKQFMEVWEEYNTFINTYKSDDLSGSQPTKGNIRGGLTTIEEKAFGNLQKIGKKAKFVGILQPAESPTSTGLWFMNTSSAAAEAVTLWAAAGFVLHIFPTGQGNVVGNPIVPVLKLSANPLTCKTMSEHIDYDCSSILKGTMTIEESGKNLLTEMIRTCNGRFTSAEVLKHREFVLTKLYRSA